ncbi:EamA family transporter [Paenibacillus sp. KN14-4R]|uniref:EamA family transporter n=1 Tax=Paenibacillus sp. KN14-4R TaxID=3445773 RepID=UPI003F9EE9C6
MSKLLSYGLLSSNIILLVIGQILFKIGLQQSGGLQWVKLILSPAIWSGLMLYGIATIVWFIVLSRLPLSVAYPMQSLAYVLAMFPAVWLFGEELTLTKVAGVIVILFGVYLIAK